MPDALTRTYAPAWDIGGRMDVRRMFSGARHGSRDPAYVVTADAIWRGLNTPEGAATLRISAAHGPGVVAHSWGPGAAWVIEGLPRMLADADHQDGFDPLTVVEAAWHPRLRDSVVDTCRTWRPGAISPLVDHLVPSILEQRVTGLEAHRAWSSLVREFGTAAPGPASALPPTLMVPPAPQVWKEIPSWSWHQAGVDPARSGTVIRALARIGHREPESATDAHVAALREVQGIGVWTLALVRQAVLGDADAVQFRDFHTCHDVVYAMTGEHRASDERLAEVLAPWAGHRYRVVRSVEFACISAPRRGPRYSPLDHRRW